MDDYIISTMYPPYITHNARPHLINKQNQGHNEY